MGRLVLSQVSPMRDTSLAEEVSKAFGTSPAELSPLFQTITLENKMTPKTIENRMKRSVLKTVMPYAIKWSKKNRKRNMLSCSLATEATIRLTDEICLGFSVRVGENGIDHYRETKVEAISVNWFMKVNVFGIENYTYFRTKKEIYNIIY